MNAWIRAIALTSLSIGIGNVAGAATTDASVEAFEQAQQAGWNAHDAQAYSAAFAPDAEVITSLGWHWTGRDDVARNMADGFRLIYANGVFRISDVSVRPLSPDLALVWIRYTISGARTPDATASAGEQRGIETQLVQGTGAHRVILSQQDTILASGSDGTAPVSAGPTSAAPAASFPTTPPPVRRCIVARASGDCLVYGKPKPAAR